MYIGKLRLTSLVLLAAGCSGELGDEPAGMSPGTDSTAPGGAGSTIDPNTGAPIDPQTGAPIDPLTGMPTPTPSGVPSAGGPGPDSTSALPPTPPPLGECSEPVPVTSQIPRMTNAQYDRTIRDLLGVTGLTSAGNSPPSSLLATDQAGDLTALAWSGYQNAAEQLAAQVMADPTAKQRFMKCTPTGDGAECLRETVQTFGRLAYRRPLSPEETADFDTLIAKGPQITENGTPDEVAEVVLSAFLMSPSFLQREELSENSDGADAFVLTSYEVAQRLSYMLWGSSPDEELTAVADADQLQTKEQILEQAQRMLADPKARDVAAEFHRSYLGLTVNSRWDSTKQKQADAFPNWVDGVVIDLIKETENVFDAVFAAGGSFQDLLLTNTAYVTAKTAPLYGLNASDFGTEPMAHELDGSRPGFLTRAGFLSAYSSPDRTSPILRGAFITKEILGIDPGTPDPSALNTPLPTGPGLDTNRKQVEEQTKNGTCAGCHTTFVNPPGFVLEAFDTSGAKQVMERDTGAPIDTVADVRFAIDEDPVSVTDPVDLMTKLAASPSAQRFYAQKWAGYAFERSLSPLDKCNVEHITAKVTAGGYSIQSLILDLTQTESFRTRALGATQ